MIIIINDDDDDDDDDNISIKAIKIYKSSSPSTFSLSCVIQ